MLAKFEACPPITDEMWPAVAHHEAGHVVAYILGSRAIHGNDGCFKVCIRPGATAPYVHENGKKSDCVAIVDSLSFYNDNSSKSYGDCDLFDSSVAIQEVIVSLAGPFAEAAFHGVSDPRHMEECAIFDAQNSGDIESAIEAFEDLRHISQRPPRWGTLVRRAARLVLDNRSAIEALAERLLVKHELDFDEAMAIVAPHLTAQ